MISKQREARRSLRDSKGEQGLGPGPLTLAVQSLKTLTRTCISSMCIAF